jgi:hypothetical protein
MLYKCLDAILDCIEKYSLNSNVKVDIQNESVNRIYMKL